MNKHFIATLEEMESTKSRLVQIEGLEIGVYYVDGEIHAWRSVCPHRGARVCRGLVSGTNLPSEVYTLKYGMEGRILRCPFHAWEFDLTTGEFLLDAKVKLRRYATVVEENRIFVMV